MNFGLIYRGFSELCTLSFVECLCLSMVIHLVDFLPNGYT